MSKNFELFFQQFLQFFEVCSGGNLVNFSEVSSRGVFEDFHY